MLCPHCQQEHPEASRFCPETGALLEWAMPTCPACEKEVHPGARFCAACGQALPREIHRPRLTAPVAQPAAPAVTAGAPSPAEPNASAAPTLPSRSAAAAPEINQQAANKPADEQKTNRTGSPPPIQTPPPLAWTAVPTGPHGRATRERRTQQRQWLSYLLAGILLIAAMIGLSAIWKQLRILTRPPASSLLSASATAAVLSGVEQPSPSPSSLPAAAVSPSPSPIKPATQTLGNPTPIPALLPSPSPLLTAASASPAPSETAAITAGAPAYRLAFFSDRDNQQAIYLMDPDHPSDWLAIPLPENYEVPGWPSFCGDQLAFEARDRSFTLPLWIFLYDLNQATLVPLTIASELPERLIHPSCSPSGRWMVLSHFHSGDWFMGLLDLTSSQIVTETPAGEYASLGFAAWTQSEDRFFWMGTRASGYFDINETRLIDQRKFSPTRLVAQGKYPAVSPDGKRMASFCGNLLYLCMVERSTNKLLFQIPVSYFKQVERKEAPASAAWSSDGKWVYFSSSTSGSWDIYRMRPDGSMIQNLTEDWPSDELMPAAR